MTHDPVIADLNRHLAAQEDAEREEEWMADQADELALEWQREFRQSGYIDALGWDREEIDFLTRTMGRELLDILTDEAMTSVRCNPEAFLEDDFSDYAEQMR